MSIRELKGLRAIHLDSQTRTPQLTSILLSYLRVSKLEPGMWPRSLRREVGSVLGQVFRSRLAGIGDHITRTRPCCLSSPVQLEDDEQRQSDENQSPYDAAHHCRSKLRR